MRCGRRVGNSGTALCVMAAAVTTPFASVSTSAVRVLTPAVSSQAFDHAFRSRPEVSSSAASRSSRVVLPNAWRLK